MEKVKGVFEGKAVTATPNVVDSLASTAAHSFAVVVEKGHTNGMNGDVKMEDDEEEGGEVAEEEEDGAPISPVSNEEIEPAEDYTLTLGEEI